MPETINKWPPLLIIGSALVGLALGYVPVLAAQAGALITPLLMIMLGAVFLSIPLKDIGAAFKRTRFTLTSLVINFIWTPALAYVLARLLLNGSPEVALGLILLLVTPCTDWYLVFTGLSRGNVAAGAAILPLNLVLQLLLLPLYLGILGGAVVTLAWGPLLTSIVVVLGVPFGGAWLLRRLIISRRGFDYFNQRLWPRLDGFSRLFLNLAIVAMFASQGRLIIANPLVFFQLLGPLLLFFLVVFGLAQVAARWLSFDYGLRAALTMTTLARNSPLALALVVSAFPDKPLTALVLVIGPLIELPVLFLAAQALGFFTLKTSRPDFTSRDGL